MSDIIVPVLRYTLNLRGNCMKITGILPVMILSLLLTTIAFGQVVTAAGADRTFEDIKGKGTIIVGIDDAFPPMGFKDDRTKEIVGLDIDLANVAARKLGLKAEFRNIAWDRIIPGLNNKEVDVIWSGLSILPEREKQMIFSQPYLESRQVIVVKKGSVITRKKDLKGKSVGFQRGSSSEKWISSDPGTINNLKNLAGYKNNVLALKDLESGAIDAVVMDETIARYNNTRKPDTYNVLADELGKEYYGVGFRKTDTGLRDAINKALDEMKQDGTMDHIITKWLGSAVLVK